MSTDRITSTSDEVPQESNTDGMKLNADELLAKARTRVVGHGHRTRQCDGSEVGEYNRSVRRLACLS